MKKIELINLYRTMNTLGSLTGVKFSYGISKNMNLIQPEIDAILKVEKSPEFMAYDTVRLALAKEHAKLDEKGEAAMLNGAFQAKYPKVFAAPSTEFQKSHPVSH